MDHLPSYNFPSDQPILRGSNLFPIDASSDVQFYLQPIHLERQIFINGHFIIFLTVDNKKEYEHIPNTKRKKQTWKYKYVRVYVYARTRAHAHI